MPVIPASASDVLDIIQKTTQRSIYLLFEFVPFVRYVSTLRHLREIAQRFNCAAHTVVLVAPKLDLPAELDSLTTRFTPRLPNAEELGQMVREEGSAYARLNSGKRAQIHLTAMNAVVRQMQGLTMPEARNIARRVLADGLLDASDVQLAAQAKFELLNRDGVLSFEYDLTAFSEVAGVSRLKTWIEQRRAPFLGQTGSLKLDPPKGVLLLGVQGCGKSLAAKAIAAAFAVPLLRLDLGSVYNKFHGETERTLRESLARAEQMSPCVLWIDEIEKGMAGSSSDDGLSRRVLGYFLTWMAERKSPVFIVATANQIQSLPPELLRKGRFDEIFFVDLPRPDVRAAQFRILDAAHFDLSGLADVAHDFSGAEIEQAVVSALYAAHAHGEQPSTAHVLESIRSTRPLAVLMAEQVQALREWAAARTVPAD
jgi:SpoVK/Ycf46/Vps4 family AAA+-type ATPase